MAFNQLAQSAKRKHDQIKSPKPDPTEEGPIDLLIVSPGTYPGAERSVWYVMFLQSQFKRTNAKAFLTIIKSLKNQDGTGWAMTYDHPSRKWFSLDNEGRVRFLLPCTHSSRSLPALTMRCPPHCLAQANGLKLKDFLANEVVAEFLLSDSVALLTFKAERTGANITTDQAKLNSDEWFMTEIVNPNAAIEAIPSSDAFDTESVVESAPSEAGSSASHAATPPSSGRGRGRGRGRG